MSDPRLPLAILFGAVAIILAIRAVIALRNPAPRVQRRLDRD